MVTLYKDSLFNLAMLTGNTTVELLCQRWANNLILACQADAGGWNGVTTRDYLNRATESLNQLEHHKRCRLYNWYMVEA